MPQRRNIDDVSRSGLFILAFQMDGLCRALSILAETQQAVSEVTFGVFRKLEVDILGIAGGSWIANWPETTSDPKLGDLIVKAEVLRAALQGFFSEDEREEYRRNSAFDLKAMNDQRRKE